VVITFTAFCIFQDYLYLLKRSEKASLSKSQAHLFPSLPVSQQQEEAHGEEKETDHEERRDVQKQVVGVEIEQVQDLVPSHVHSQSAVGVGVEVVSLGAVKLVDEQRLEREIHVGEVRSSFGEPPHRVPAQDEPAVHDAHQNCQRRKSVGNFGVREAGPDAHGHGDGSRVGQDQNDEESRKVEDRISCRGQPNHEVAQGEHARGNDPHRQDVKQNHGGEVRECAVRAAGPLPQEEQPVLVPHGNRAQASETQVQHDEKHRAHPILDAPEVHACLEED